MRVSNLLAVVSIVALGSVASAQETTQVTTFGNGDTTTTIASPSGTTQISTSPGQSMVTRSKDGTKIELDSDNSVYTVYPDGSRVAAPNGVNTLMDGETITVKDGKRMP
jgi:hypothetical protein